MVQRNYLPTISIALAIWFCLLGQQLPGQQVLDAEKARQACVTPHKLTSQMETRAHVVANAGKYLHKPIPSQPRTGNPESRSANDSSKIEYETNESNEIVELERPKPQPLVPGLNTQSDSAWISSTERNGSKPNRNRVADHQESASKVNRFLHHQQVDFVSRNDLACASPRMSRLLETTHVDPPESDLERSTMLQPLTKAAMKIPKRHELEIAPEPAAAEHVVTTVHLNDSDGDFAYSSVNDASSESDSLSRSLPPNQSFSHEAQLRNANLAPMAAINFSDTPATSFSLTDNRTMQAPIAATNNSGLLVHPPMLQPYNENQFTFVVENSTQSLARDVAIEISVSANAKIVAALPANSVSSDSKAVFKFNEIPAGDKLQLHLNAISRDGQPIDFAANVVTRSTYDFAVKDTNDGGRLASVSHHLSDVGTTNGGSGQSSEQQPTAGGPRLVQNPYFQDENPNRYSGNRPTRH